MKLGAVALTPREGPWIPLELRGSHVTNDELAIRDLVDVDALAPLMEDDMVFLTPGREPFGKREFLEGYGNRRDR